MSYSAELDRHIDAHFKPTEFRDLISGAKIDEVKNQMNPFCQVSVNIPAHHAEPRLRRTLAKYAQQASDTFPRSFFEIAVLVNGAAGVDLPSSPAYQGVLEAKDAHPKLNIKLFSKNYGNNGTTIGHIRSDLATLTMVRAAQYGMPLENLVLVTNDADLVNIPANYLQNIHDRFTGDESLAGMTGPVLYPKASLGSDDLALSVQRFMDFWETILRKRHGHRTMRGGNSAFRASSYIEAGGHAKKSRVSENRPLLAKFNSNDPGSVVFDRGMWIETSPRRHLTAIAKGEKVSTKHNNFGKDGDLAEEYRQTTGKLELSKKRFNVLDPRFRKALQDELQTVFHYDLFWAFSRMKGAIKETQTLSREERMAYLYDMLAKQKPEQITELEEDFKLAGAFLGVKIKIHHTNIAISRTTPLRNGILERYRHF